MADLHLHHLSKHFRRVVAVGDISLTIPAGTITALLGASGSGKSTLLALVAGLIAPDQGRVYLGSRDVTGIPPERRGVGLVPQQRLLFPHLSVGDNIAFGLKMRGVPQAERESLVTKMLEQVQLSGFAHRDPRSLSGGQAQRVALARALVVNPTVVLLDEPLSALDAHLRQDMQTLIQDLHQKTGTTMLLVTHDQQEASLLASCIAVIDQGHLLQTGSPLDCYRYPRDPRVARCFGGVNFWPGGAEGHRVVLDQGLIWTVAHPFHGRGILTIRPELVRVQPEPSGALNSVVMRVQKVSATGVQWRVYCRHDSGLTVQAWLHRDPQLGETAWVECPPEALWMMPESRSGS